MKEMFRKIVYKYDILFRLYYNFIYKPLDKISIFLDDLSRSKKGKIFFIQVGANDGNWGDKIYKFIRRDNWNGILIEPQKVIFKRLLNNYKKRNNLFFENVAIDSTEGERNLYKIGFTDSPWASGISSFIKNDVQKLIDAGYIEKMANAESIDLPSDKAEWISEEKVKVQTLKNIIDKYRVNKIDLLVIDAEGYDFEIIKTIPFEQIKPTIIIYENSHFSEDIKKNCQNFLINFGYKIIPAEGNTVAELV
ncbi:MAG: FkbM family methyltransferase [bacterium]|nr:FkbM family methyltransferase [bacterium]